MYKDTSSPDAAVTNTFTPFNGMLKKYSISVIIAVVLITPITVFALVNWMEKKWSALPVFEGENYVLKNVQLQNQNGAVITPEQWKGKIVVVNFFFTHCPVICPKMTANLKTVRAAFPLEKNLLFNSFSVDPERDSLPQLAIFAQRFGIAANWNLLTGDKHTIYDLARKRFSVVAEEADGHEPDFIHSEKLVLLDKTQRIRGYYPGTSATAAQQLIQDIKKLQDEK